MTRITTSPAPMSEASSSRPTSPSMSPTFPPHSPSLPTQTFHPALVSRGLPGDGLFGSAAGGAHYSGAKVTHRRSDDHRISFGSRRSTVEQLDLDERRTQVMNDLKELYCCRPSLEIFQRSWRNDAVFEDPLTHAKGIKEVASQWFAMPKIISHSVTVASRILASTTNPNRIIYSQTQEYTVRVVGMKKTVKSIIVVDLDDEGKIAKLLDQWHGEEPPTRHGMSYLRRLNGKGVPLFVKVPRELRKSD